MRRERKKHLFIDCDGFSYHDSDDDRLPHTVLDLCQVTCGHCKARILRVIQDQDWSTLSVPQVQVLAQAVRNVK